ncbi:hypothetical protein [Primorskyibacter sp. 2E233]|uniref:hypothetical protein n=1 Tax=Primorskyibacter sp. 2E233 TaxID=3413431 RepID=UPI003BF354C2
MKLLIPLLLALISASTAFAREPIAQTEVNGKPAIIFDDGFWRYDDEVGEVCTQAGKHGAVCAFPSQWSRLPDARKRHSGGPEFVQGEFLAEFQVLQPWEGAVISETDVMAFIGNQTFYDGLKGTVVLFVDAEIGNLEGKLIVISAGQNGVFAFTYANQNGRFLIARTKDQDSTIFHSDHRNAHQSFVDAIRPEPFEKP